MAETLLQNVNTRLQLLRHLTLNKATEHELRLEALEKDVKELQDRVKSLESTAPLFKIPRPKAKPKA
jgi:flagellin-like hook-associated protein FlgL